MTTEERNTDNMVNKICLFDMDGTLTKPRNKAEPDMIEYMKKLRKVSQVGIVSGADLPKIKRQLNCDPFEICDYVFPENGVVAYKSVDGKPESLANDSMCTYLGEERLQDLLNFVLGYFATIRLPCKRGTFVEYRTGMLNFSPIGRACSQSEWDAFEVHDKEHGVRDKFVAAAQEFTKDWEKGVQFAIGGQISVDCFPKGWDKRRALHYVEGKFNEIHFYGDRTGVGGNDREIFEDERTIGHTVTSPTDTMQQLSEQHGI